MKKLLSKPFVLPVFLLVLYLSVLALGIFAIAVYPISRQEVFFLEQARNIAQEHLEGTDDTLRSMIGANMYISIYDSSGVCLQYVTSNITPSSHTPVVPTEKDLSRVLSREQIFHPVLAKMKQRSYSNIMVATGVPIIDNGTVIGAVFLIKNLMDLPEAIAGYAVYCTFFYWLSAYFVVSNIRKGKKLDQLRQNYIANVTHALKTPVASIKALSETLCDEVEPDPNRQRLYYGMILREANRQDHMIRDILELSKLQSNGMDFSKTKFQAGAVFDPVVEKYAMLADCMDITLHVSEHIEHLPPLYSNAACIKQILEILMDNALKFVPEGGDIWIDAAYTRKHATFCIRDNGIGIAKEALHHVFDRFYKYSHDFNEGGSGLGLAIAKEIIVGLKEKIWVESEPEQGAAFYFTVRLK